ncbi:hypothetical protein T02_16046 [Trichinella nativa]|uniref:Uncharacterized protein n=1 Tax=Trichinella nativa TaxID=6335 RepID=A0A0V1KTG4_9BILA|nr:hypothetical protein T02_11928 [Trichinella nativa]KRZ50407.1 hypothetical protein T02_16046 [Trichinella nativa]
MNSQLISNYFAHGWYLFETLENSTSMYNGDYYWHLRNDCVLYSNFVLRASNFVPIQEFQPKLHSAYGINWL